MQYMNPSIDTLQYLQFRIKFYWKTLSVGHATIKVRGDKVEPCSPISHTHCIPLFCKINFYGFWNFSWTKHLKLSPWSQTNYELWHSLCGSFIHAISDCILIKTHRRQTETKHSQHWDDRQLYVVILVPNICQVPIATWSRPYNGTQYHIFIKTSPKETIYIFQTPGLSSLEQLFFPS